MESHVNCVIYRPVGSVGKLQGVQERVCPGEGLTKCPHSSHPSNLQDRTSARLLTSPFHGGAESRVQITELRVPISPQMPHGPLSKHAAPRLRAALHVFFGARLIAVQGHSGPRPLLPRAGCAGKRVKRPGKSPQAVSNCSNLCDSVCSLKCIYLRKSALSSSLSQYSAARPASERQ